MKHNLAFNLRVLIIDLMAGALWEWPQAVCGFETQPEGALYTEQRQYEGWNQVFRAGALAAALTIGLGANAARADNVDPFGFLENWGGKILVNFAQLNSDGSVNWTATGLEQFAKMPPEPLSVTFTKAWQTDGESKVCPLVQSKVTQAGATLNLCWLNDTGELRARKPSPNELDLKYLIFGNRVIFTQIDVPNATLYGTFTVEIDVVLNLGSSVNGAADPDSIEYKTTPVTLTSAIGFAEGASFKSNNVFVTSGDIQKAEDQFAGSTDLSDLFPKTISSFNGSLHEGAKMIGTTLVPSHDGGSSTFFVLKARPSGDGGGSLTFTFERDGLTPPAPNNCSYTGTGPVYAQCFGYDSNGRLVFDVNDRMWLQRQQGGVTAVADSSVNAQFPRPVVPEFSDTTAQSGPTDYEVCAANDWGTSCSAPPVHIVFQRQISGGGGGGGGGGDNPGGVPGSGNGPGHPSPPKPGGCGTLRNPCPGKAVE